MTINLSGQHPEHLRSYAYLAKVRAEAAVKRNYNSEATRMEITEGCQLCCGFPPYREQLDLAECLVLGIDCTAIAKTGWGKTIPFVLPLFILKNKIIIIISPLNALGLDQAARFRRMQFTAVALNSETYTNDVHKDIINRKYRIIIASPELALDNDRPLLSLLRDPTFSRHVAAFIVDEAHCITQWGETKFRPEYSELGTLRAYGAPVLALSATLTPAALAQVRQTMHIIPDHSFHLNLGNDRPNIYWQVRCMDGGENDFGSLSFLLPTVFHETTRFKKTMVFFDSVDVAMKARRWFETQTPSSLHGRFRCYFAVRSTFGKSLSLTGFVDGDVDILFTTEAAGMGCDFPGVEIVVQYLIPASLSVWIQRAGRGGRRGDICAQAILLVQPSVFQEKGKKKRGEGDPIVYVKDVEEWLRKWIETTGCRRDIIDECFDNPRAREPSRGGCCDNCNSRSTLNVLDTQPPPPSTLNPASNIPATPRPYAPLDVEHQALMSHIPAARREDYLKNARKLLEEWRLGVWKKSYSMKPFGVRVVLPDTILTSLASKTTYRTIEDLKSLNWFMATKHGEEALSKLYELDLQYAREKLKAEKAKHAAEEVAREVKRKERDEMRAREKAEKEIKRQTIRESKRLEEEKKRAEKQQKRDERKRQREQEEIPPSRRPSRAKRPRLENSAGISESSAVPLSLEFEFMLTPFEPVQAGSSSLGHRPILVSSQSLHSPPTATQSPNQRTAPMEYQFINYSPSHPS